MDEHDGAFEQFMAARYPDTPLKEAVCTVEQMREAFEAGRVAGYNKAESERESPWPG